MKPRLRSGIWRISNELTFKENYTRMMKKSLKRRGGPIFKYSLPPEVRRRLALIMGLKAASSAEHFKD